MVGSYGTLGVLTEINLKTSPRPEAETTIVLEADEAQGIHCANDLARAGQPLSASAWIDGKLMLRLSGGEAAISHAATKIGGERVDDKTHDALWTALREHRTASSRTMCRSGASQRLRRPSPFRWGTSCWSGTALNGGTPVTPVPQKSATPHGVPAARQCCSAQGRIWRTSRGWRRCRRRCSKYTSRSRTSLIPRHPKPRADARPRLDPETPKRQPGC